MNRIAKLIKAKTIDFTQVLIKYYKSIWKIEVAFFISTFYEVVGTDD